MIEQFHFLRPWWLLLLLPLAVLIWQLARGRFDGGGWRGIVDPQLLPHVLSGEGRGERGAMRWLMGTVAALSIVAMAGPTWEKLPQPVYQKDTALAIVLDLSRSMNAADIKPSRLVRARHKIADILNLRLEGQTALVVYAADAFTVTPLTSDVDTILALLPDLDSALMPAQGSRADRAFERAFELFANAAVVRGDVLLISDAVDDATLTRIERLHDAHPQHRVSVLAVGTDEGAPVPLEQGGFLKTADGSIVIPALGEENLSRIADFGGGVYATISSDDIDINSLAYLLESSIDASDANLAEDLATERWREFGPWLLLVALPLAALAFRRGALLVLPLCLLSIPPDAYAFDWSSLWQNDDQRARGLFERGDHAAAAELFDNPDWKGASRYRAQDYQGALENWGGLEGEESLYNAGNALARLGRYEEALKAYDSLLERNPDHEDALFNKRAIEEFMRQQQQQEQSQSGDESSDQQSEQNEGGEQSQSGESGESGSGSSADSGQSEGEAQDNQSGQQQQGEGQAAENDSNDESGDRETGDQGGDSEADDQQRASQDEQQPEQAESPGDGDPLPEEEKLSAQAAEQWLRKIPDDPGGLLRRKFLYQFRERGGVAAEAESW